MMPLIWLGCFFCVFAAGLLDRHRTFAAICGFPAAFGLSLSGVSAWVQVLGFALAAAIAAITRAHCARRKKAHRCGDCLALILAWDAANGCAHVLTPTGRKRAFPGCTAGRTPRCGELVRLYGPDPQGDIRFCPDFGTWQTK